MERQVGFRRGSAVEIAALDAGRDIRQDDDAAAPADSPQFHAGAPGARGGVPVPGAVLGAVAVAAAAPGAATTRRRQHLLLLLAHPALRCPLAPWPPTTCASTWTETG